MRYQTLHEPEQAFRKRGARPSDRRGHGAPATAPARPRCACGGGCPKCRREAQGRQAREEDAGGVAAAAAAAPAAAPEYRDCTPGITGIDDANDRLETARQRARDYVGAARRALANAPTAGSVYETALGRHFIAPTDAQRTAIADTYRQINTTLVVSNYICNSQNICGAEQAFWIADDELVHVCRPFWPLSPTCRAIVLLHEGAHDVGINAAGAHAPNRGSADYPAGNNAAPAGQTTAGRMDNPDAYAFFAAHIWRDSDTSLTCF